MATENVNQIRKAELAELNNVKRALNKLKYFLLRPVSILPALFAVCSLLYYFGELAAFAGWEALQWEFFYSVHDTHRLLFLAPIIYAGYIYGTREALIVTLASLIVFIPRAVVISSFPDAIPRAVFFTIVAGFVGSIVGLMSHKLSIPIKENKNGRDNHKKVEKPTHDGVFTAGDLEIDFSKRLIKRRGQTVKLTPTEYELLSYFIMNSGKLLSHTDLLRNVWGPEYGQESEYLRTYISQLRRKIEDDPSSPQFIVTESGVGYRFVEPKYTRTNNKRLFQKPSSNAASK